MEVSGAGIDPSVYAATAMQGAQVQAAIQTRVLDEAMSAQAAMLKMLLESLGVGTQLDASG